MGSNQTITPQLELKKITDPVIRKNFEVLSQYFSDQNQFLNFKFFEYVFTGAQKNVKIAHGLNAVPLDVVMTHVAGSGVVTFNNTLFDTKNLDVTSTGACRIRFFIGSYWNFQSAAQDVAGATQMYSASAGLANTTSVTTTSASGVTTTTTVSYSYSAVTSAYLMKVTDNYISTSGTLTVTLYSAVGNAGKQITISKTDNSTTTTIAPATGQTIYGFTSIALFSKGDYVTLVSNGINWLCVARSIASQFTALLAVTTGNYTTLAGCTSLDIEMCGGGGGGGGSSNNSGWSTGLGGTGGTSLFGTSLLSCTGGSGGVINTLGGGGATPGVATCAAPAIGILVQNGTVGGQAQDANLNYSPGGPGGGNPFGGQGMPNYFGSSAGQPNTGAGGSGGGTGPTIGIPAGGGAGGAYIKARILDPFSIGTTFAWQVAAGGTAGPTDGTEVAGGAGGTGRINIWANF